MKQKTLTDFWTVHRRSEKPLKRWYKIVAESNYANFNDLRKTFPSADLVDGTWVVFDIGGNKYRLATVIHFNKGRVYIRAVMTHDEYDSADWKTWVGGQHHG